MAVVRWVWGNANSQNMDIQEYQIRLCDEELKPYRGIMTTISNRLVSVVNRYGELTTKRCWFAGKISSDMYVIALGGEQNSILGTQYAGTRGLFGVMALGFTGKDICLYRQTEELFNPLKQLLREVNEKGKCKQETVIDLSEYCFPYIQTNAQGEFEGSRHNILRSEPRRDAALWKNSLIHPVMTGVLTAQDAKRLLNDFRNGVATVCEDISISYIPRENTSAVKKWMEQEEGKNKPKNIPQTEKKKESILLSDPNTDLPPKQTKLRFSDIAWGRVFIVLIFVFACMYIFMEFAEKLIEMLK